MNIRDLKAGMAGMDRARSRSAVESSQSSQNAPAKASSESPSAPAKDSVEISRAARIASQETEERLQELSFAQNALHSVPDLTPERVAEIQTRLQEKHYLRPEVSRAIARSIGDDLP